MIQQFSRTGWLAASAGLLLLASGGVLHAQDGRGRPDDWFVTKTPPKSSVPPKQISSSELIPILPGPPAVPESATERKRPPSPDYLMGKVMWGQSASIGDVTIHDWNLAANDLEILTQLARQRGLAYFAAQTKLSEFDYNPKRLPALMISGVRPLRFTPAQTEKLREYVLAGGMIVCDSVYGSPHFYESALEVFQQMFPESRFRVLPADHPIYHMLVPIEKVSYACGPGGDRPFLEGLYVGSRVGVLLSRSGLGCGWEAKMDVFPVLQKRGLKPAAYSVESARALAQNLAAYIVGYAQVGEIEGQPELFGLPDQKDPTAEFVFAQVKHDGAWNAHPGAARSLLLKLKRNSSIPVNLKRAAVDPAKDDLSPYPFLYLTGLDDFALPAKAVENLRKYVEDGGTLLVNNGLGLASFHQAVPRELSRIFPDKKLKQLAATHPIFSSLYKVTRVDYSPVLRKSKGKELGQEPVLYGIAFGENRRLGVIYSPYDLEAGWNEVYYPLVRGYEPASAQLLGMNIITYAMTH
jgi:hypothetical protein